MNAPKDKQLTDDEAEVLNSCFSHAAYSSTESNEKFSNWILGGFGLAFALIISNIDSISSFINTNNIKYAAICYSIAFIVGLMQRWLITAININKKITEQADSIFKSAGSDVDPEKLLTALRDALFPPGKIIFKWLEKRLRDGDTTVASRLLFYATQLQGFLVITQGLLVFVSICFLVFGITK